MTRPSPSSAWCALGLLCVILASGCTVFSGVASDAHPRAITATSAKLGAGTERLESSAQSNGESPSNVIFLVDDRSRLIVPVTREIGEPVNRDRVLRELFESQPTVADQAKGLVSVIPGDVRLLQSRSAGGVITIELNKNLGLGGEELSLAAAQIVFTATQNAPESASVQIVINGEVRDLRTAKGTSVQTATRSDFSIFEPQATPSAQPVPSTTR